MSVVVHRLKYLNKQVSSCIQAVWGRNGPSRPQTQGQCSRGFCCCWGSDGVPHPRNRDGGPIAGTWQHGRTVMVPLALLMALVPVPRLSLAMAPWSLSPQQTDPVGCPLPVLLCLVPFFSCVMAVAAGGDSPCDGWCSGR